MSTTKTYHLRTRVDTGVANQSRVRNPSMSLLVLPLPCTVMFHLTSWAFVQEPAKPRHCIVMWLWRNPLHCWRRPLQRQLLLLLWGLRLRKLYLVSRTTARKLLVKLEPRNMTFTLPRVMRVILPKTWKTPSGLQLSVDGCIVLDPKRETNLSRWKKRRLEY